MADQTPQEIQNTLGITSITLRRWCDYHKTYLSTGTQPRHGQARRFTGKDLEVLRHVQSLRDQGMTTAIINEHLSTLTFAEIDTPTNDTNLAIVDAPDTPDSTPAPIFAPEYLITMQRDIEALKAATTESKRNQRDGVIMFGVGFLAACGLFILLLLLFLARHWL